MVALKQGSVPDVIANKLDHLLILTSGTEQYLITCTNKKYKFLLTTTLTISEKKILKAVLGILICWGIFVAIEGFRLIGSTDPGKCPLITLGSTQTADEIADYGSLGFSQTYHLTNGDAFVYGEFRVWGIRIARWES